MAGQSFIGVEGFQESEPCRRTVHHGSGDGVVERHHRIVRHAFQQAIKRQDLRPVGILGARGFVMHRGDRGLQLIRPNRSPGKGVGDERDAL